MKMIITEKETKNMLRTKSFAVVLAAAGLLALPAFSQETPARQDATVQAFGSFVKSTTDDNGVQQNATNSGGILGSYRFFFNDHHGVELNYGYTLNTQNYALAAGTTGLNAYSHEATAAYVLRFPKRHFTPFVLAGAGALVFDPNNVPSANMQARPAFLYGGGADINITNRLFFRAGYRGLLYNSPNFEVPALNVDRLTHRAEPFGGIGYRF
jgi:opacity protein-like surface antigen